MTYWLAYTVLYISPMHSTLDLLFRTFMELPTWCITGVLVSAASALIYTYGTRPYKVWRSLEVQGPRPMAFLGNMHEMFDPALGFRTAIQRWQAHYGRIFGVYFFRKPVLVVTDPEALKQIFVKDFNVFVDRFFVGEGKLQHKIIQQTIFFAEGATWRRLRKLMTPTFSSGKLKLVTQQINRTAGNLRERLCQFARSGEAFQTKDVFGAYALDVIGAIAFGLDVNSQQNNQEPFILHAKSLMTVDKIVQLKLFLAGAFPACIPLLKLFNIGYYKWADVEFFQRHLKALVFERSFSEHSGEKIPLDFLRLLMEAEADSGDVGILKLSKEEVVAQCLFFLIAGYETTATTLQYLAYELAKQPEIQDRLLDEIVQHVGGVDEEPTYDNCQHLKLCEAAIEETLRMYPPVHILTRQTTEPTVLCGIPLPANVGIVIPVYNIGRDPDFYPDPDTFNPDRFYEGRGDQMTPMTFAPFGLGPRQCIGMRLALMELKIALVHVLRKVRIVHASPEVLDIDDYSGMLAPKVPIKITVEKRRR